MNIFGFTSYELTAPIVCGSCGVSTTVLKGTPKSGQIVGYCLNCGKYVKNISPRESARLRAKGEDKKGATETVNILTATKHEGMGSVTEIVDVGDLNQLRSIGEALQNKYDSEGRGITVELDRVPGIHALVEGQTIKSERFGVTA